VMVYVVQEVQQQVRHSVEQFEPPQGQGAWQACLHRVVLDYLVHHGYCATALAFSSTTGQPIHESHASIKNRQRTVGVGQEKCVREGGVVHGPVSIAVGQGIKWSYCVHLCVQVSRSAS